MFNLFKTDSDKVKTGLTARDYISISSEAYSEGDYKKGLAALKELGKTPQVFNKRYNSKEDAFCFSLYAELAGEYFDIDPDATSEVLFSARTAAAGLSSGGIINSHEAQEAMTALILGLTDELVKGEAGPEAYQDNPAKSLSLAFKNRARLMKDEAARPAGEVLETIEIGRKAAQAGEAVAVAEIFDTTVLNAHGIQISAENGFDDEDGVAQPCIKAFQENLFLAVTQAKNTVEEEKVFAVAGHRRKLLDCLPQESGPVQRFRDGAFDKTIVTMRDIAQFKKPRSCADHVM